MGFLIRFAIKFCFWMMLVSLFIPPAKDEHGGNQPGPLEAFTAAREAIVDLGDFCNRKPQACETGKAAFANAGERAGDVAKAGYDYLDTQLGKDVPRPDAAVAASHGDAKPVAGADAIKAKLRELALRELIEAADRQSEASPSVDKKAQTGTVIRN
ncbi:DUF5330 domain-containing protein [Phyllobacterium sp. UNC302MFCol5.2]|uniref:DUF5330 domain-containing protein n=1 Tax=Phyllobacterium sp. UNC302MFCol5.2 TaxID=1449065 RepID=UPI00068DB79F|nr:DUF5330 domain-containing protein [Phyllobacterium sp. UNC302MFCol5.2]